MSAKCEGYQPSGEDFDLKYRISGNVVWVRVSRGAVDDFYGLKGGAREKFAEMLDDISAKIGADLEESDAKGHRHLNRRLIKSDEFARIMKAA